MKAAKISIFITVSIFMVNWLVGLSTSTAQATNVKWDQIIGIIQAENLVGSGTGQVTGGTQPWSTSGGFAIVNLGNGNIEFLVQGLVLAGGGGGGVVIGTAGPVTEVKGTLVCNVTGPGDSVLVDTVTVSLSPQGDAHFSGNIGSDPNFSVCVAEPNDIAFLIRIVTPAGAADLWLANGAVRKP